MSVELVTGYYGVGEGGEPKRHVSSAEDGARQAGTLGLGCYALSTGSKLSATMEDANTLVVADGDVMMNGRHVSMPDPTSFTIPTGVQGQKVSNIAVLRYQKAADSVESVTPVVLTGEPSTGEPTDPEYNEGSILDGDSPVDFPLYRVVTDGINAGDPEPLFDVLAPMAELRDLVSQRVVSFRVTKSVKLPAVGDWEYIAPAIDYDELHTLLGRPFDAGVDQVVATNVVWNSAQVLAVPFVQTVDSSRGGSISVAITTPTGQSGGGSTRDVSIMLTVIKGK